VNPVKSLSENCHKSSPVKAEMAKKRAFRMRNLLYIAFRLSLECRV
jgi:hypothetical protein